jgi:hypothetical protein
MLRNLYNLLKLIFLRDGKYTLLNYDPKFQSNLSQPVIIY